MDKKLLSKLMPHRKGTLFFNEKGESFDNVFGHTALMFLHLIKNYSSRKPKNKEKWIETSIPATRSQELVLTWIGHASFLIQVDNVNILVDPTFYSSSCFFPRIMPPGITQDNLPPIDFVLLSHNHRDHMDRKSLRDIINKNPRAQIMVPMGDRKWFGRYGYSLDLVSEFNWWESINLPNIKFTFLPAYHWSQRWIFDRNKSLWGSWMIEVGGQTIYFGGDTANWKHFEQIAQEFPRIDVALMPVGPCEPRNWMEKAHLSPEQAGKAFLTLNAQHFIPMHWGTFFFGIDYYEQPIERLLQWWKSNESLLGTKQLHINKMGKQFKPQSNIFDLGKTISNILEI